MHSPQWPYSFPLGGTALSFYINPLLRRGARNKVIKEGTLLRGRWQVCTPNSSCSLHFSSFLQKLLRLLCLLEVTLQSP